MRNAVRLAWYDETSTSDTNVQMNAKVLGTQMAVAIPLWFGYSRGKGDEFGSADYGAPRMMLGGAVLCLPTAAKWFGR